MDTLSTLNEACELWVHPCRTLRALRVGRHVSIQTEPYTPFVELIEDDVCELGFHMFVQQMQ